MSQVQLEQECIELHSIIEQPQPSSPVLEAEIAQLEQKPSGFPRLLQGLGAYLDFGGRNNQDIVIKLTEEQRGLIFDQTGKDLSVLRIEADKSLYNPWGRSHEGRTIEEHQDGPPEDIEGKRPGRAIRIELSAEQMNQVWQATGSKVMALELTPKTIGKQRNAQQITTANAAPSLAPSQTMAHPKVKTPTRLVRYWERILGLFSK